jgi:hypothetical protein
MSMMRSSSRASCGLSITAPSSVLVVAERGSRFIEPTNSCLRSITTSFACRRPSEAPNRNMRSFIFTRDALSS